MLINRTGTTLRALIIVYFNYPMYMIWHNNEYIHMNILTNFRRFQPFFLCYSTKFI